MMRTVRSSGRISGVPGPGGVYLVPGGVPGLGGVPGPRGGVPGPRGVYLVWGVYLVPVGGGCTWSWGVGVCTWSWGGVYLVPGGGTWSGTPPVDRHTPVKT